MSIFACTFTPANALAGRSRSADLRSCMPRKAEDGYLPAIRADNGPIKPTRPLATLILGIVFARALYQGVTHRFYNNPAAPECEHGCQ